jgi:hypothetical protein
MPMLRRPAGQYRGSALSRPAGHREAIAAKLHMTPCLSGVGSVSNKLPYRTPVSTMRKVSMPMSLDEIYKAVMAFDTTMSTAERVAFSRMARSSWLEKGGTDETFRSNFPAEAAELDAAERS